MYPILVVVAVIKRGDSFLLIKRNSLVEGGRWAFPGGTGSFENYSDPVEAVKDEVQYDLNVNFFVKDLIGVYFRQEAKSFLSLVYFGEIKGEPKINKESVLEFGWFSFEAALDLDLDFDHREILEDMKNRFKN